MLYERASQLTEESRGPFLEEEERQDPALAGEVMRLLALTRDAKGFLEDGPGLEIRQIGNRRAALEKGFVLSGRFEVESFLGAGGMGEVYRAWDRELRVQVAIKTLHIDRQGNASAQERLRREVLMARKVTHPNVCRIYDAGRHVVGLTPEEVAAETGDLVWPIVPLQVLPGKARKDYRHVELTVGSG